LAGAWPWLFYLREFHRLFVPIALDPHCFHGFLLLFSAQSALLNTITVSRTVKQQFHDKRAPP
jgi:hypothetical protein